jgi:hypothetical protein
MVQPIDQGAIMRSGMSLVPDYAAQVQQELLMKLQQRQVQTEQLNAQRQFAEASQKARRQQEFQGRIAELEQNPEPRAIARLMTEFPEFSEGLKRAYDATDAEKKQGDMAQLGEVYSYLGNGNVNGAVAALQRRVDADKAAGREADEEGLLEALKSGEPEAVKAAQAQLGMALATLAGPAQFASVYSTFDGKKTTFEKEYDFILETEGPEAAANFVKNKSDPLTPITNQYGTSVYRSSQLDPTNAPSGAAPAAPKSEGQPKGKPVSDAGSVARSIFPDIEVTQVRRDPNSSLGKKNPKSWHNKSGAAVDAKPIPGMTFSEYVKRYRDAGYTILEARDEVKNPSGHATGPHWHVVLGGGPKAASGPVRVNSRQQYAKLPSGTEYIAPDGSTRVKP